VAKDRARPFSRKHRKYWIPVTGGMILIGIINVALGWCSFSDTPEVHERIKVVPDEHEDPAAVMAREAAKRALAKRAAQQGSGSGSGSAVGSGSGSSVPR
jgi:hypothetical protein